MLTGNWLALPEPKADAGADGERRSRMFKWLRPKFKAPEPTVVEPAINLVIEGTSTWTRPLSEAEARDEKALQELAEETRPKKPELIQDVHQVKKRRKRD
jgi:hypothetical protein